MKVDRSKFLALVLGLGLGRVGAGCIIVEEPHTTTRVSSTSGDEVRVTASASPAIECTGWDATGECSAYEQLAAAPADECTGWDATGECVDWDGFVAESPAIECTQWDPSGECIGWDDGYDYSATQECIDWDPSGECIGWSPQ